MSATIFRQEGDILNYSPAAATEAGELVFLGPLCGQLTCGVGAGELGAVRITGVIRLTKESAVVFNSAASAPVHYDTAGKLAIAPSNSTPFVGVAVAGGADGETYVDVLLNGAPAATSARVLRVRATTAEVNAGLTLLPAIPGRKYRIHDVALIAIGGAAATATTVDIIGTQSASAVKLLAAAVAGLTQNTLLRAGAANAAILAGGVSFVANDVNTSITIGKTGSNLATATHIDVLLTYSLE